RDPRWAPGAASPPRSPNRFPVLPSGRSAVARPRARRPAVRSPRLVGPHEKRTKRIHAANARRALAYPVADRNGRLGDVHSPPVGSLRLRRTGRSFRSGHSGHGASTRPFHRCVARSSTGHGGVRETNGTPPDAAVVVAGLPAVASHAGEP